MHRQHQDDFYPRPPRGGRRRVRRHRHGRNQISIHALREEGDSGFNTFLRAICISIHALREEGDLGSPVILFLESEFLSTPSARRATYTSASHWRDIDISIHALREEGDQGAGHRRRLFRISIHALREEGDRYISATSLSLNLISIHALREEGDCKQCGKLSYGWTFLSTPSARRATGELRFVLPSYWYFYPRPPRGGRLMKPINNITSITFLSTPSARRATSAG